MTEFVDCDECGNLCYGGRLFCKECLFIRAEHKQIETTYGTIVDEELVTVLEYLWDIGLETSNSCQNNHGNIWIEFETDGFMNFMETIRYIENIPLYKFLLKSFVLKKPMAELTDDDDSVAVRFPRKHLVWFEDEITTLWHILMSSSDDENDDDDYDDDYEDYEDYEDEDDEDDEDNEDNEATIM